ncbi:hypothetical protein DFH06DRAFT_595081 [Mycena polygramma]|nr:hypothetical protein DFH06DRAFT_595081 [Mycena polygramma]
MSVAAHSSAPVRLPAIGRPDVAPRYAHGHGHAAVRSPPTMPIRLPSYKELTAKARCEEVVGPGPALPMPPPLKSASPSSSNGGAHANANGSGVALGLGGGGGEREGKPRSSLFTAGLIHLPPLTGLLKPSSSATSSPATTPRPSLSSSSSASASSPSGIQRLLSGQAPQSQASGSVLPPMRPHSSGSPHRLQSQGMALREERLREERHAPHPAPQRHVSLGSQGHASPHQSHPHQSHPHPYPSQSQQHPSQAHPHPSQGQGQQHPSQQQSQARPLSRDHPHSQSLPLPIPVPASASGGSRGQQGQGRPHAQSLPSHLQPPHPHPAASASGSGSPHTPHPSAYPPQRDPQAHAQFPAQRDAQGREQREREQRERDPQPAAKKRRFLEPNEGGYTQSPLSAHPARFSPMSVDRDRDIRERDGDWRVERDRAASASASSSSYDRERARDRDPYAHPHAAANANARFSPMAVDRDPRDGAPFASSPPPPPPPPTSLSASSSRSLSASVSDDERDGVYLDLNRHCPLPPQRVPGERERSQGEGTREITHAERLQMHGPSSASSFPSPYLQSSQGAGVAGVAGAYTQNGAPHPSSVLAVHGPGYAAAYAQGIVGGVGVIGGLGVGGMGEAPRLKFSHAKAGGRTKKQALSCYFCRERKIACGRPEEGSAGAGTGACNQCARRKIECRYPTVSHRGQHSRIKSAARKGLVGGLGPGGFVQGVAGSAASLSMGASSASANGIGGVGMGAGAVGVASAITNAMIANGNGNNNANPNNAGNGNAQAQAQSAAQRRRDRERADREREMAMEVEGIVLLSGPGAAHPSHPRSSVHPSHSRSSTARSASGSGSGSEGGSGSGEESMEMDMDMEGVEVGRGYGNGGGGGRG